MEQQIAPLKGEIIHVITTPLLHTSAMNVCIKCSASSYEDFKGLAARCHSFYLFYINRADIQF
jgi:hypothetical protein